MARSFSSSLDDLRFDGLRRTRRERKELVSAGRRSSNSRTTVARVTSTPTPSAALDRGVADKIRQLFGDHVDSVFNVAARILWNRSDAEDVVQATFIKAAINLASLRDDSSVRPWLLQIAHRESISVLRRRRDVPTDPGFIPDQLSASESPEDLAVGRDIVRAVNDALESIAVDERAAVVLRDIEGLSMREVSETLGVGLSAAKMRVHRGRSALRLILQEELR